MLTLDQPLPPAILIGQERPALAASVAALGGQWFTATPETLSPGTVGAPAERWRASVGGGVMARTRPNSGGSRIGADALLLEAGRHGGFVLDGALATALPVTVAVVWRSSHNNGQTLLTIAGGDDDNILFLAEMNGTLTAKDRGGAVEASLPLPPLDGRPRLAVMSAGGGALLLEAFGASARAEGTPVKMDQPGSLFVGSRSHKPKLLRTLGDAQVMEVLVWPGRSLLARARPEDEAALGALQAMVRWGLGSGAAS